MLAWARLRSPLIPNLFLFQALTANLSAVFVALHPELDAPGAKSVGLIQQIGFQVAATRGFDLLVSVASSDSGLPDLPSL